MMRYHNIRWGNELSLSGLPLLLQRWASHESAGFSRHGEELVKGNRIIGVV